MVMSSDCNKIIHFEFFLYFCRKVNKSYRGKTSPIVVCCRLVYNIRSLPANHAHMHVTLFRITSDIYYDSCPSKLNMVKFVQFFVQWPKDRELSSAYRLFRNQDLALIGH